MRLVPLDQLDSRVLPVFRDQQDSLVRRVQQVAQGYLGHRVQLDRVDQLGFRASVALPAVLVRQVLKEQLDQLAPQAPLVLRVQLELLAIRASRGQVECLDPLEARE